MEDNTNIMSGDLNALKQFRDMVSSYNEAVQNSAGCASDEKRLEKDLYLTGRILRIILTARLRNAVVRFRISLMKRYPKIKINSRESRTDAEKLRIKALKDV